ncbi:hypothetical protein CHARACLAT_014875 [Characodon lateralis]|uniref:Uncharacterized protein n=1 Tax=Characodon lateralis TaxID=208331 RepID=A0ABU7EJ58_9TELE|nr:hypothetical protein [Characodon lateralis]
MGQAEGEELITLWEYIRLAAESCTRQAEVAEEQRVAREQRLPFWGSRLAIPLPGGGQQLLCYAADSVTGGARGLFLPVPGVFEDEPPPLPFQDGFEDELPLLPVPEGFEDEPPPLLVIDPGELGEELPPLLVPVPEGFKDGPLPLPVPVRKGCEDALPQSAVSQRLHRRCPGHSSPGSQWFLHHSPGVHRGSGSHKLHRRLPCDRPLDWLL